MRPVAVFDTNILFSAVGWKGKPFECVELARAGAVEGVTCREILEELAEKLESKLLLPPEDVVATVADLMTFLRVVTIAGTLKVVAADPDDDKILEEEVQCRQLATWLCVGGNSVAQGVRVMKETKRFDCLEMKRALQAKLHKQWAGLTTAQIQASITADLAASQTELAKWWRKIGKGRARRAGTPGKAAG